MSVALSVPTAQTRALAQIDDLRATLNRPDLPAREAIGVLQHAETLAAAARAARLGLEVTNEAAEVKIRAERRCGALLALEREAAVRWPRRGAKRQGPRHAVPRGVLAELGITGKESSRWQLIAALPEPEFELRVQAVRSAGRELSSTLFVRAARQFARQRGGPKTSPTASLLRRVLRLMRDVTTLRSPTELELARQVVHVTRDWDAALRRKAAPASPPTRPDLERRVTCVLCGRERPAAQPPRCTACGGVWI